MKKLNAILFVSLMLLCGCGPENSAAQGPEVPGTENPGENNPGGSGDKDDENGNTNNVNPFNFKTRTVLLNSGYEMPIIGIGTYMLSTAQAEESVYNALKIGVRLFDTADIYGNERGVGRGTGIRTLSQHEVITEIASAHGKSPYQVLIRWHLQSGNIAIPGSSNAAHIAEDYDVFDFELTPDEMKRINALDCNHRFANY